jgi:hypothetical protein
MPTRRISPKRVDQFVERLFEPDLHAKRVLSLANATVGALQAATLSIHAIGRALAVARDLDAKHAIKQVDRLLSNQHIAPLKLFPAWVAFCRASRTELVVSLDWTEFDKDGHSTLALNLITKHGRATPLMWRTVEKSTLEGWHNAHEDTLLWDFKQLLPPELPVKVTLLADRGFGDQALYRYLSETLGFDYIIRSAATFK